MQFIDDVRYAVRQFAHAPGFTATAALTIALGIGATTAIFTLVHAVLLKSLPVAKPGELYRIGDVEDCCVSSGLQDDWSLFSYDKYKGFRDETQRVHRIGRLPGGTQSDGRSAQRKQSARRVASGPVRFRKLLLNVWNYRLCGAGLHKRR